MISLDWMAVISGYQVTDMGQKRAAAPRDATIIDFVGTNIFWGIITVSRILRLLCIHSFHNIKSHSLDIKVLFVAAFWNRNNTVTNNTAQNINTKEKKSISPIGIKKGHICSINTHVSMSLLKITNGNRSQMHLVFSFLLDPSYRTWKDGEFVFFFLLNVN